MKNNRLSILILFFTQMFLFSACIGGGEETDIVKPCLNIVDSKVLGLSDSEIVFTERNLTSGSKPTEAKLKIEKLDEPKYPENDVFRMALYFSNGLKYEWNLLVKTEEFIAGNKDQEVKGGLWIIRHDRGNVKNSLRQYVSVEEGKQEGYLFVHPALFCENKDLRWRTETSFTGIDGSSGNSSHDMTFSEEVELEEKDEETGEITKVRQLEFTEDLVEGDRKETNSWVFQKDLGLVEFSLFFGDSKYIFKRK